MNKRIGIFAGSFDPVHNGHIAFALEAIKQAKLDEVYFLPEVKPRGKVAVTHIGHRVVMLNIALKPHARLHVLELPEAQFTITKTWPKLRGRFGADQLFLLMGSNTANPLASWPHVEVLLKNAGIIVAKHKSQDHFEARNLPIRPKELIVLDSPMPNLSSSHIRSAIQKGKPTDGLPTSIQSYIKDNWLYSLAAAPKNSG